MGVRMCGDCRVFSERETCSGASGEEGFGERCDLGTREFRPLKRTLRRCESWSRAIRDTLEHLVRSYFFGDVFVLGMLDEELVRESKNGTLGQRVSGLGWGNWGEWLCRGWLASACFSWVCNQFGGSYNSRAFSGFDAKRHPRAARFEPCSCRMCLE
jgi:hypothetical protein